MDELENGFVWTVKPGRQPVEYYIPEELIALILSFVDSRNLISNCRLVCKAWKRIVDNFSVREKAERECGPLLKKAFIQPQLKKSLPWHVYYLIMQNVFGRNFLKNSSGRDGMKNWKVWSSGGDGWLVEQTPIGADPLPKSTDFEGNTSCYATSYQSCSKAQVVNLKAEGLSPRIMDKLQPPIRLTEWYSGRFDCGCIYELKAALLDKRRKPMVDFEFRKSYDQWDRKKWEKVEHTFKNYGPGVRFVTFYHGGSDTQFWAGHYGCKMTGGTVMAFIPQVIPENFRTLSGSSASSSSSSSPAPSLPSSSDEDEDSEIVNVYRPTLGFFP